MAKNFKKYTKDVINGYIYIYIEKIYHTIQNYLCHIILGVAKLSRTWCSTSLWNNLPGITLIGETNGVTLSRSRCTPNPHLF